MAASSPLGRGGEALRKAPGGPEGFLNARSTLTVVPHRPRWREQDLGEALNASIGLHRERNFMCITITDRPPQKFLLACKPCVLLQALQSEDGAEEQRAGPTTWRVK